MPDDIIDDVAYIDKAIEVVSRVHGYTLGKNDPVLVTATLNHFVYQKAIGDFRKAADENLKKYIDAMEENKSIAKDTAVEIIKSAIEENSETLQAEAKKAADIIHEATSAQETLLKANNNSRNISIISSAICLASMITVLLVMTK